MELGLWEANIFVGVGFSYVGVVIKFWVCSWSLIVLVVSFREWFEVFEICGLGCKVGVFLLVDMLFG